MPESAFQSTGLVLQLFDKNIHCRFISLVAGFTVKVKQHLSGVNEIQVISGLIIQMDFPLFINQRVGPLLHIIIVTTFARCFPHLQHGAATHSLGITEEQALAVIQPVSLRKTHHLGVGKPTCIRALFPCIRTERHCGQTRLIIKIYTEEVTKAVTYGNRLRHLWSGNFQPAAFYHSHCRIETPVGSRNQKALDRSILRCHQTVFGIFKTQYSLIAADFHRFEERAGVCHIFPILFGKRPQSHAFTRHALITRMNIRRIRRIRNNRHAHILQPALPCFELCFTNTGRLSFMRSNLHEIERHIGLFPFFPPTVDHIGKYLLIFFMANGIGFSLIPNISLHRISQNRMNHTVPKRSGDLAISLLLLHILQSKIFKYICIERIVLHNTHFRPRFRMRTSPCRLYHTYRHIQFLMQPASENESHSREVIQVFRRAHQPPALTVIHFTVGSQLMFHPEQTKFRIIRVLHLLGFRYHTGHPFFIGMLANRIFHIGLSGTEPHFTYQYIINSNRILTAHRNRLPFCSRRRFQFHSPFAVSRSLGCYGFIRP